MSIKVDRSNSEAMAASHASALAPSGLPISVTCWVYVEAQPGGGETHTVWWYGRDGIDSQFLKLTFLADTGGAIKFQATFRAGAHTASATATGHAVGAWHCVSVVVEERTGPSEYRLRLYVDDDVPEDGSSTASGALVSEYDIFALGRASGANKQDYASCRVEQVAAWKGDPTNPVLSESDNATMFNGPIAPRDAKTELDIDREPDLAYWMLAGHARSALRINSSQDSQLNSQRGELFNELGIGFPIQQIQPNVSPPRWSAKTPIFRWKYTGKPFLPIQDRPPKAPRSRLQPRFVFFSQPVLGESSTRWPNPDESSPVWAHPNFEHLGQTQFHNAGALRPTADNNEPRSDLAIVAVTMADWLAFQGFAAGTGTEGGGQYEGAIYLRGIGRGGILKGESGPEDDTLFGWDLPANDPGNPFGVEGEYLGIPLLQHPFDHIDQVTSGDEVDEIWNVWYRNNGLALCREWSEQFWQALKEELDDRGLCYPARLHWDFEDQPAWASAMHASVPIGNWKQMTEDPRFDDAAHPVYVEPGPNGAEWTLEDVDGTRAMASPAVPEPIANQSPWATNIEATNWLAGWVIAMGNSGLYKGVIEPALGEDRFPETKWSNYWDFVADHPDYRHPLRGPQPATPQAHEAAWYNTPVGEIHADFSSPVLYNVFRRDFFMREDSTYHYGATPSSVYRGTIRARIDACVNAREPLPLAPWITGSPSNLSHPTYETTFEDSFDGFAYAWKRGVDEFVVWVQVPPPEEPNDAWDRAWFACNRLLDWVHVLPQAASGARVARMSRLGRRQ